MPRNFGGRSSSSRGRSSSNGPSSRSYGSQSKPYGFSSRSSYQSKPQPTYSPTPPVRSPGMLGGTGLGSTIAHGMAFGGGSEVGHQLTRSMFGGHGGQMVDYQPPVDQLQTGGNVPSQQQQQEIQKQRNPCLEYNYKFIECLKGSENDIAKCQSLFDDLKACEKKFY